MDSVLLDLVTAFFLGMTAAMLIEIYFLKKKIKSILEED
jgi:hypothetical protein